MVDEKATWCHQGYAGEEWVKQAWNAYRTADGMPPTDGWKTKKANSDPLLWVPKGTAETAPAENK